MVFHQDSLSTAHCYTEGHAHTTTHTCDADRRFVSETVVKVVPWVHLPPCVVRICTPHDRRAFPGAILFCVPGECGEPISLKSKEKTVLVLEVQLVRCVTTRDNPDTLTLLFVYVLQCYFRTDPSTSRPKRRPVNVRTASASAGSRHTASKYTQIP